MTTTGTETSWDGLPAADPSNGVPAPHRAAQILRTAIAVGRIAPGTKLPEVKLTEKLGVSRHTLRSAFQLLAAEGLVDAQKNRGVFVHSPTSEEIREIYRVRRVIEPGLIRATAVNSECLEALRQIVNRAEEHREHDDVPGMAQANQEFHQRLIAQIDSSMLEELMAKILARMRLIFAGMRDHPDFHSEFVAGNMRLVQLLAEGEDELAEQHLRDYLDAAERRLLAHLET